MDARCDKDSTNIIIYGRNLLNGSQFGSLDKYKDRSYLEKHETIQLELKDGIRNYKVFAVLQTKQNDRWFDFISAEDFADYEYETMTLCERALLVHDKSPYASQSLFDIQALKLKKQEKQLKEFCDKTDLRIDSSRVRTVGFGKSTSQKAVHIDKAVTQVNELYKTDFGHVDPYKVYELDQAALKEKRLNFTSDFKKSGNIAVMEYDGQYYYAHSMANASDGVETSAYTKYKGDKSHLAVTSDIEAERNFTTFDVNQSDGKEYSGGVKRTNTFEDTEAKLFESLENIWYNNKHTKIYILSERGMCDSCKSVVKQFKAIPHKDVAIKANM